MFADLERIMCVLHFKIKRVGYTSGYSILFLVGQLNMCISDLFCLNEKLIFMCKCVCFWSAKNEFTKILHLPFARISHIGSFARQCKARPGHGHYIQEPVNSAQTYASD